MNLLLSLLADANMVMPVSAGTTAAPVAELNMWDLSLKGGVIMIPLLILSILAIYIFIERAVVIRKAAREDRTFMDRIKDYIHEGDVDAALNLCKKTDTPYARLIETVTGMVRAFYNMASAGTSADITTLSGGIYEALVTTVAGLVVGIIALFAYNYLVARVDGVVNQLEAKTMEFMDLLNEPAD